MKKYIGLSLIIVGCIWLATEVYFHFTYPNILLILPYMMILSGSFLHVFMQKRTSKY